METSTSPDAINTIRGVEVTWQLVTAVLPDTGNARARRYLQDLLQTKGELGAGAAVSPEKVKRKPRNASLPPRGWSVHFLGSCFWFRLLGAPAPLGRMSPLSLLEDHSPSQASPSPTKRAQLWTCHATQPGRREVMPAPCGKHEGNCHKHLIYGQPPLTEASSPSCISCTHPGENKGALKLASYAPPCKEDSSRVPHSLLMITGLHLGRPETSIYHTASFLTSSVGRVFCWPV